MRAGLDKLIWARVWRHHLRGKVWVNDMFCCGADTVHKPGFKIQARILHHLFSIVSSGAIKAPLWDLAKQDASAYRNNVVWARERVTLLLTESFPNLRPHQVEVGSACCCDQLKCKT